MKVLLAALLLLGVASAQLTDECIGCMCKASSGCVMQDPPCFETDWGSYVCSPWKFTEPYWMDGGYLGKNFETCGGNWACSEDTVRGYLHRYAGDYETCETYARTHLGGPWDMNSDAATNYWRDVQRCLAEGGYIIPDDPDATTTASPDSTATPEPTEY